jgi:predicted nucleic acid-binding protein
MNTNPREIETKEDVERYRDAFDAAILALRCPSEADAIVCHALGVAL